MICVCSCHKLHLSSIQVKYPSFTSHARLFQQLQTANHFELVPNSKILLIALQLVAPHFILCWTSELVAVCQYNFQSGAPLSLRTMLSRTHWVCSDSKTSLALLGLMVFVCLCINIYIYIFTQMCVYVFVWVFIVNSQIYTNISRERERYIYIYNRIELNRLEQNRIDYIEQNRMEQIAYMKHNEIQLYQNELTVLIIDLTFG